MWCLVVLTSSDMYNAHKFGIALLWLIGIGCAVYSFVAFSATIDAVDAMSSEPAWARWLLPAFVVSLLAFISSSVWYVIAPREPH